MNMISNKECLLYNNSTWSLLVEWFKNLITDEKINKLDQNRFKLLSTYVENEFNEYYNSSEANEYTTKNSSLKLAKLVLMLSDVNDDLINKILFVLIDRLCSANKYIYMPSQKIDRCLFILNNMLKLFKSKLNY